MSFCKRNNGYIKIFESTCFKKIAKFIINGIEVAEK